MFQDDDVVEDPDTTAVRADHQIVFPRVHEDVVDGHGRHVQLQRPPDFTAVAGKIDAYLVAEEQQILGARVLVDNVDRPVIRQAVDDRRPVLPVVVTDVNVGAVVVAIVAVKGGIDCALVEIGGLDSAHVGAAREARHILADELPARTTVTGYLEVAVVGAGV